MRDRNKGEYFVDEKGVESEGGGQRQGEMRGRESRLW